jgi:hypothetical protein
MSHSQCVPILLVIVFACASISIPAVAQQPGTAPEHTTGTSPSTGVPETCPVTKESDRPFVPPMTPFDRWLRTPNSRWFGTDNLWTTLPADGTWSQNQSKARRKLFWFKQGYDYTEPQPRLTVTGRRLDAPPPVPTFIATQTASNGYKGGNQTMGIVIDIPTLGCWEITGHYEGRELSYVIWVRDAGH